MPARLATGSPALVLDEPTSALDLGNQARTLSLVAGLGQARERAIPFFFFFFFFFPFFTTHDPNHALAVADDVALMMPDGEIVQGPVGQMITPDLMSRLYGVPMHWARMAERETRRAMLPAFTGRDVA